MQRPTSVPEPCNAPRFRIRITSNDARTVPEPRQPLSPTDAVPPHVAPAAAPGTSGLTGVVVGVVIVAALYVGREVLVPITLAFLLCFVLSPLVAVLRRIRLGRILSVVLSVVVALGIILALGTAIGTQVADLAQDLPRYETTIQQKVEGLRATILASLSPLLGPLRRETPGEASSQTRPKAPAANEETRPAAQAEPPSAAWALKVLPTVLRPILNPLATFGIILVVTIFALLQKEDLRDRAIRLFGSSDLQRTTLAMDEAGRRLARYFLTQLGINTAFGLIVGTGLYWIGVPNPALWGIASALLRFIPYVGSWIAAALPLALAAASEPGWSMAIWTAVLYAVVEVTLSQVVEPLVYGHSTGLSPFAVIVAAIFWTWLWGPIGLIISTPLTLCLVVLGRHIEHLEFIDVLLGDRPALSPVENLYQRMLANDPDEAVDQAEAFLKTQSFAAYYDDVVVTALRLAATDVQRGAMTHARIAQVRKNVDELVSELADYEATSPTEAGGRIERDIATTQGERSVLCIAGRGPLDEPVAAMLAQLLEQRGLGARVVPNAAVSRETIASLDVDGVAMACVVYVEIHGHPAHLRLLLRRLRARLPAAPLLVGLWPADDPLLADRELQREVGAAYCVSSLGDAVTICVESANAPRQAVEASTT